MIAYIKDFDYRDMSEVVVGIKSKDSEQEIYFNLRKLGGLSEQPSDRLLKHMGLSRKDWDTNKLMYSDMSNKEVPVQDIYYIWGWGVYEDQLSYKTALNFVTDFNARLQR